MKLSPKIANLTTPDTEMLHIMINNSLYIGIMKLGHFWKIEIFFRNANTKRKISRNNEKLDGYCKLTLE
jgi:hypothetical protein